MLFFGPKAKRMELEEVEELMSKIATPLSLYLMPTNYDEEKEKFYDSSNYNPQFKYRKANKNNDRIFRELKDLQEITDIDPEISKYIIKVIKYKKQASDLLESIGEDERFVRISKERFGVPSHKLFKKACKILRRRYGDIEIAKRNNKLREKILRYDDLVPIFEKVFEVLGLDGWTFEKSKAIMSSGFRTTVKTKRVMVDPKVEVSAEKLRKTIIHEVGTHALRGHNGYKTGYKVFGKPNLPSYLDYEEGLAMYNEENYGVLRDIDIKKRAAYVYAIYLSRSMSFREVYDAVHGIYPRKSAFDVVYRVKRGLSDTSKPGCYYKDQVYLRGFFKTRRKLEKDVVSYKYMYAGKIPYKYIYLVEEGIIPKPNVVPSKKLFADLFEDVGLTV
jgi:hypothetical protein